MEQVTCSQLSTLVCGYYLILGSRISKKGLLDGTQSHQKSNR